MNDGLEMRNDCFRRQWLHHGQLWVLDGWNEERAHHHRLELDLTNTGKSERVTLIVFGGWGRVAVKDGCFYIVGDYTSKGDRWRIHPPSRFQQYRRRR